MKHVVYKDIQKGEDRWDSPGVYGNTRTHIRQPWAVSARETGKKSPETYKTTPKIT